MHSDRKYSLVPAPTPATDPVAAPSIAMSPAVSPTPATGLVAPLASVTGSMADPVLTTDSATDPTPATCPAVAQTFLSDLAVTSHGPCGCHDPHNQSCGHSNPCDKSHDCCGLTRQVAQHHSHSLNPSLPSGMERESGQKR